MNSSGLKLWMLGTFGGDLRFPYATAVGRVGSTLSRTNATSRYLSGHCETIDAMIGRLPAFQRISVGFPGVVKGGVVVTAPNLGTPQWVGCELSARLAVKFNVPVRISTTRPSMGTV